MLHTTDVLVVGGGPAGICAAIAAPRAGADVALVERYGHFGGLWTGGLVLLVIGHIVKGGQQVCQGIGEEMMRRLDRMEGAIVDRRPGVAPTVDAEAVKYLMLEMLEEAGVKVLLHCWGVDAIVNEDQVQGAVFESKSGRQAILAKTVIDATGDGDVFAAAGAAYERRAHNVGLVLAGAALGYPVLLGLDPLALLSGAVGTRGDRLSFRPSWGMLGLGLVLMVSLLWPHVWCRRLCPLGGLQDVLAAALRRAVAWKSLRGSFVPAASSTRPMTGLPRRMFLGGAVGLAWAAVLARRHPPRQRALRPPGAAEVARFTNLCLRCGNCVRACPAGIIRSDTGQYGIGGLLAPLLSFDDNYCWESCNRCTLVCPSGAISPVTLALKPHTRIGVPQVDMNICLLGDDRECAICRNRCPYDAIRLVFDDVAYTLTPRVDLQRCNGCGACQVACPTQPRKAIEIG